MRTNTIDYVSNKLELNRSLLVFLVLILATIVVGVSILLDGAPARVLNGLGGLIWFAASALSVWEGVRRGTRWIQWIGYLALTAAVAFVVRPTDFLPALVGFCVAGALAAVISRRHKPAGALMIPALYLPMHIGTAVIKALVRDMLGKHATIRSEPPPTAALVPLVIVIAAVAGGYIVANITRRHQAR